MGLDAAPQRPFGGDAHRVWRDPQRADTQLIEVRLPSSLISKPRLSMCSQLADDSP